MKIKLEKLSMRNFKGSPYSEITFSQHTDIFGENKAGKTRILDAFLWLLFGKDSEDKSDFSIKPLDENNNVISKLDVEVEGELSIDSRISKIMKVYKEKWTKKRGELTPELTGHETIYYIDGINVQKKDYDNYINSIINVDIFRYVTNPVYFENQNWTIKRKILFELAKVATDFEIADGIPEFEKLLRDLTGKDLQVYKKNLNTTINKMKDDLALLPPRIDETIRQRPESLDFILLKKELSEKEAEMTKIDSQIRNITEYYNDKNSESQEINNHILTVENQINDLRLLIQQRQNKQNSDFQLKQSENQNEINRIKEQIRSLSSSIEADGVEIEEKQDKLEQLRVEWKRKRDEEITIKENQTHCPTCRRIFENIDEIKANLQSNFNQNKIAELAEIEKKAGQYSEQIATLQKAINNAQLEIDIKKALIEEKEQITFSKPDAKSVDEILVIMPEYRELKAKKESLQANLPTKIEAVNTPELDAQRKTLYEFIIKIKEQLAIEVQIEKSNNRVKELEAEMIEKGQQIADLEKEVYTIDRFTRKKIELVESLINAKFGYVKFKLYNQLINGGEEECCITLINGVPYNSTNYASRINAGLDIINVLSKHYDVFAPVFIDNRESISEIQPMSTQVINLFKEKGTTKLRIENAG
jgi:DNA repair exonuclease SbcCD ATPase subunit